MTLEWPPGASKFDHWLSAQCEKAPALMAEINLVLKPPVGLPDVAIEQAVASIKAQGIGLIGLTGDPMYRAVATRLELQWVSAQNVTESNISAVAGPESTVPAQPTHAMVVEGPVRSGVQIYAKDRDLVVWGQVSAGAEIMADGHVHVYGRLLGRVAAGVSGATDRQIFCQQFEPTLVSIAGIYASSDQVPETLWSATVRVGLDASGQTLSYQTHE